MHNGRNSDGGGDYVGCCRTESNKMKLQICPRRGNVNRLLATFCLVGMTLLAGCGGGGGSSSPSMLTVSPSSVALDAGMTKTFAAAGGTPPYTFSLVSGTGSMTAAGSYSAPIVAGSAVVRATDSGSQHADASITVNAPVGLSAKAPTMDGGTSQTLLPSGGQNPYSFSIVSGLGTVDAATGQFTAPAAA